jgi:hypothetical protein
MKKTDDLLPQYAKNSLGKGIRGKYLRSYRKGSNVVVLSPDVADAFPTEEAVNDALRLLLDLAGKTAGIRKKRTKRRLAETT